MAVVMLMMRRMTISNSQPRLTRSGQLGPSTTQTLSHDVRTIDQQLAEVFLHLEAKRAKTSQEAVLLLRLRALTRGVTSHVGVAGSGVRLDALTNPCVSQPESIKRTPNTEARPGDYGPWSGNAPTPSTSKRRSNDA